MSMHSRWSYFRKKYLKDKANFQGYYTCNICQQNFKDIEIDHIIKRSVAPDRVFDLTNLQLLCHDCHMAKDQGFKVT